MIDGQYKRKRLVTAEKKKRRLPVKRLYKHIYIQKNEWVKKKKWKDKSQQNKQTNKV